MNQRDLMKAIRELPDETVEKFALPKQEHSDQLHQHYAAGKEKIIMTDTTTEKKSPIRAHRAGIAAAILLCLGLNAGLFYGISKMRADDSSMTPGHAPVESVSSETEITDGKMPDLIGMDYQEAVLMYGDVLGIEILSQEYSEYDADRIFNQDIEPGTPIQKGDTVHVKVSIGQKKVQLPDITGWDFETAKTTLLNLELYVDKRMSYDEEVPEGKVISMDPAGPIEIEPGSYVRVTVSLGKNKDTVLAPNFVNTTWDNANQIAEGLGIVLAKNDVSNEAPAGTVLYQNIVAGEEISEGSVIELDVSSGTQAEQPAPEQQSSEKEVRITFNIPADVSGTFHIVMYQNGIAKAVGSAFNTDIANGVAALTVVGSGTAEYTAVLFNDETNAEATIGTYQIDFENDSVGTTNGNTTAAFEAVTRS